MIYLAIFVSILALAVLIGWLGERRFSRRARVLREILDSADALERELLECRARLREIPALVATLPPAAQLSARATLTAEPQVQAALRDLLAHRLWLKDHAAQAPVADLRNANAALTQSLKSLREQLARLAVVRKELEDARVAAAQAVASPHP